MLRSDCHVVKRGRIHTKLESVDDRCRRTLTTLHVETDNNPQNRCLAFLRQLRDDDEMNSFMYCPESRVPNPNPNPNPILSFAQSVPERATLPIIRSYLCSTQPSEGISKHERKEKKSALKRVPVSLSPPWYHRYPDLVVRQIPPFCLQTPPGETTKPS